MITEAYQKQLSILKIVLTKESPERLSALKTDCLAYLEDHSEIILKAIHLCCSEEVYSFLKTKVDFFLSFEESSREKINLAEFLTLIYVLEEFSCAIDRSLPSLKKKKKLFN